MTIQLNKSDREHCTTLSFEVAPNSDFGALARELAKDGVRSELRNDSIPGMGQVLSFKDNKGTTIELFKEWSYLGKHQQTAGIGPLKLGHVAFYTPDIPGTVKFYEKVLGFRHSDTIGDFFVFMRCGPDHHTVNFFRGPDVKLHHMAFELKDFMHLQNSCELMGQKKVPILWGPLRHGPGHNIATYHRNQDGQMIEFFCELDKMLDEDLGYFEPRPWPHRRRLDRQAARAPHQEQLEVDEFGRAVGIGLGAHADQAIAQPPLQRAEALPFEPIERIAGRMRLRDRRAGELLPQLSSWHCAQERLSWPWRRSKDCAAGVDERPRLLVVRDLDRHAARLPADIGGEREQRPCSRTAAAAPSAARRGQMLMRCFEIDRPTARRVEGG